MKYISLVLSSLFRKKVRTVLTLLSIVIAFMLFGLLQAVNQAFNGGAESADADRMITNSKYSIINMLPIAHKMQIESVPGVKAVAFASWFGGLYQDKPAKFGVFPVVPDEYLKVAPEIQISPEALAAWNANRTGAVVGEALAKRMNWKVGDVVPLQADIWPQKDGSLTWAFTIVGIFQNTKDVANGDSTLLFRYDYFDEARQFGKGTIGWFLVKVDDRRNSETIGKAIDARFGNSGYETKTQTEQAFAQSFAKQFGDIALIVSAILGAVFFTILVLSGNTMSQAMRERIRELGTLKALGFSNAMVCWLVLAESLALAVLGAVFGLLLSSVAVAALKTSLSGFGIAGVSWKVVLEGFAFAALLGVMVGAIPSLTAMRLKIVDALKR